MEKQDSGHSGLVVYSSKTGNTRKLAEGICQGLAAAGFPARIAAVEEKPDAAGASWVLAGFWADRGNADAKMLDYIRSLAGQKIGVFGTLGAEPDSDHARELAKKVETLAAEKNTCLGSFLCQGKIDPALTARFKDLPPEHPHAMTEERRKRHEEAAKHPDEADITAAVIRFRAMLETLAAASEAGV
jgi:flavodoxin